MDTFDCIRTRRSIRKFLPNKIPEPVVYKIMDAANAAPCAGNIQNWRFIITQDEDKIKLIAKAALEQDWIATAPIVILVLSDSTSLAREYGKRGEEMYALQNTAMAMENLILAAWGYGIGSTIVGAFSEVKIRKEFQIPDHIKMHAIIPLGYPAEMPRPLNKPELPDVVDIEIWGKEVTESRQAKEGFMHPDYGMPRVLERAQEKAKKIAKKTVGKINDKFKNKLKK